MIYATFDFENQLFLQGKNLIAGIDEVGRGCFAGPVVAAAVVVSPNTKLPSGIADSKLLSVKKREKLAEEIKSVVECFSIAEISVEIINKIGIGKATQQAFVKAIQELKKIPEHILIDAFYIADLPKENQQPIIHGDQLSASIAAASIIAKVYRDNLMEKLHETFPQYGFATHKGYGTKMHQEAIKKHGLSQLHRTSFNLSKFL